jgi:hypothetical protein
MIVYPIHAHRMIHGFLSAPDITRHAIIMTHDRNTMPMVSGCLTMWKKLCEKIMPLAIKFPLQIAKKPV